MLAQLELPETLDELHHWGVKGMRWGIRKDPSKSSGNNSEPKTSRKERRAKLNEPNPNYTLSQRRADRGYNKNKPSGFEKAVNRRMNKGASMKDARSAERTLKRKTMTASVVGSIGAQFLIENRHVLKNNYNVLKYNIHIKAQANRGKAAAAAVMADAAAKAWSEKGIGGLPVAKLKKGVYNVTSMK